MQAASGAEPYMHPTKVAAANAARADLGVLGLIASAAVDREQLVADVNHPAGMRRPARDNLLLGRATRIRGSTGTFSGLFAPRDSDGAGARRAAPAQ